MFYSQKITKHFQFDQRENDMYQNLLAEFITRPARHTVLLEHR